ncbi:MAG TPA: S1/P1 nuclease, partial [Pyrinomonadaceae bacterium]|nr:S1/P1 nuclease [Pyrinomonadaceae bacterium]
LGPNNNSLPLHSYWDGIVDRSEPRLPAEVNDNLAYLNRMIRNITQQHPRNQGMINRLRPGDFDAWALEGFDKTKRLVYPSSLQRGQLPGDTYRLMAFRTSKEAIALAGYRLADLMNQMLGSMP